MSDQPRYARINISAIPVAGIGGLGMIAIAAVIAITMPLVRWVVLSGAVAGTLLGGALILIRRRRRSEAKAEGLHDI
ncbi:MAG: hypothetical protein DMF91_14845 [Acidobacteria bacterium]|nr:MAG: hypothetical protein DMF91_14845 [Acidobacteriota bacterium]